MDRKNGGINRWLTVEEMLVVLLIIEVSAVLLDLVDAESGGVDLLGAEVEVLEVTANLAVLLAILLNPHALDIGALDDVVPLLIGLAVVRFGLGGLGGLLERLDGLGGEESDLVPDGLGLGSHLAELVLESREPVLASGLDGVKGAVLAAEDLLVQGEGGGGRAEDEGGG